MVVVFFQGSESESDSEYKSESESESESEQFRLGLRPHLSAFCLGGLMAPKMLKPTIMFVWCCGETSSRRFSGA